MNNVSLIGRLTADPELRHTQSGMAMVRFTLAVDRNFTKQGEERQTDFISCVAWDKRAEMISRYFSKGNRMGVVGEIRTGSYTDRDGNKRYTTDVVVNGVDFCESKGGSTGNSEQRSNTQSYQRQEQSAPAPSYSSGDTGDFMQLTDDEDLPF